jgi:hypothetical protein
MSCPQKCPLSPSWILSLATLPVLSILAATDKMGSEAIELGKLTEEIFRGDRLPLLDFPEPTDNANP